MGRRRRMAVGAGGVGAAILTVALAGCGPQADTPASPSGSAPTSVTTAVAADPEELLRQATQNMLDAPSKRLVGRASLPIGTQDFEIVYVGQDARGTQTSRAMGLEIVVEFVRVGDSLYILADEAYWQNYVRLEQLHLVINKWVRVPADSPSHSSLLVLSGDDSWWESVGDVTQVDTDTIDGTPVVVLQDSAGSRFMVSAEGTPYLRRAEGTQNITDLGDVSVEVAFSELGTVTDTIAAPTGEIVDLG